MTELRRWMNLLETTDASLRSEILRLFNRLPNRWRNPDGAEVWKNQTFKSWLVNQSDELLPAILDSFRTTLEYLTANPKAKLSDPFKTRRLPRVKAATLTTLLSRAGHPFQDWLKNLLDDPADLAHVMRNITVKHEYLIEYLRDELSVSVCDNGLITFWTLSKDIQQLIGDLPVALYHFTSSAVMRSIRTEGLHGERVSVNRRTTSGVYLTTETNGPAVTGYIRNAVAAHGGSPIKLTVKCYLIDLTPDPDDADISSGQHQFLITSVSPEQIISVQTTH